MPESQDILDQDTIGIDDSGLDSRTVDQEYDSWIYSNMGFED